MSIKVAVPSDDGELISQHFGQAKCYKVFTLDNNQVSSSEMCEKASHSHGDYFHPEGVQPRSVNVRNHLLLRGAPLGLDGDSGVQSRH